MNDSFNFKFFIVDDDPFCSSAYEQHLNNIGFYDIYYFQNGDECLDNLFLKPDIILLDHNMDNLSGFEVLKKIKRFDPNIYVVMISGQDEINVAVESLKYGAFDYVIKDNSVCEKLNEIIQRISGIQLEIERLKKNKGLLNFFKLR